MSNTNLSYRLRIRNAADSADALVITSVRGGTNPYIAEAPSGDGQELDPLTGAMATGQYTVRVLDPITSGTNRVVTSQLFDSDGRQLLLSRRTYVELSTDGGSTWSGLIAGYTMGYRLSDAITWEFSIGDTRRVEQTKQVFDGTSTSFAKRGCIFGGPIAGGGWGPVNDRGGWKFKVASIGVVQNGCHVVAYTFVNGYRGINDPLSTRFNDVLAEAAGSWDNWVNDACQSYYSPSVAPYAWNGAPGLICLISELVGGANGGQFNPSYVGGPGNSGSVPTMMQAINKQIPAFTIMWPAAITLPSVNDVHTISCFTQTPCDASPVYLTEHPVDLVTKLWTDAGIAYDATAASNLKTLMGSTLRVSMRITQSTTLLDFLEKSVFGPFGMSARTNSAGALELFSTRLKQTATPSVTIATNDLQGDAEVVFDNDEQTIVYSVRYKTEAYWAFNPNVDTSTKHPLDSIYVAKNEVQIINADTSAFSTTEQVYEMQGMIHDSAGVVADMNAFAAGVAQEIFDRFGRGAPAGDLAVLRGSDTGFAVGDELYIEPAHFPNLNKRFGDDPSVGARIMQILKRTETPAGPIINVMDAGSAQQPVVPAPTITIAADAGNPRSVADFTVTNAAAINATGVLLTTIQWASGGSAPSSGGPLFTRYTPGNTPTGATQLPAVAPGTKVWVRARTEQVGRRPSAWTSWVGVTLTAVAVPSGLSFTSIQQNSAKFNWTNANATDYVDVYVYKGGSPPGDWTPWFVCTLPPGSTSCVVRNLDGPTVTYQGAVFHRDPLTGKIGTVLTGSFATNSTTSATAPTPQGMEILPTTQDASLASGVVLALYPADPVYDIVIERAPDVAGSPGAYAVIAQVRGLTQIYVDKLPLDGAIRWYRIKHSLSGITDSGYVAALSALPAGCSQTYVRPPFTLPQLQVVLAQTSSIGSATLITVTVLDPQGGGGTCTVTPASSGVSSVTDFTTGLPAAPYTATIGVARNFQINLNAPFAGSGYVSFTAVETSRYNGYGVWFGPSALQNAAPLSQITIAPSTSLTTATAKASAFVSGPSNAASGLWLASTVSAAAVSRANVIASGASVSSGAPIFTIPDLGVNLALGDTVYLGVVYYDALGNPQTYALVSATRFTTTGQKTTRYQVAAYMTADEGGNAFSFSTVTGYGVQALGGTSTGGTGTPDNYTVAVPVALGATVNAVRINTYTFKTWDQITMALQRQDSDGSATQLGSTQTALHASFSVLTVGSLTDVASSGRSYLMTLTTLRDSVHAIFTPAMLWFEVDTSFPDVVTNL